MNDALRVGSLDATGIGMLKLDLNDEVGSE